MSEQSLRALEASHAEFTGALKNPARSQEQMLLSLISANRSTVYGQKYSFHSIRSIAEYRKIVPVVAYEDLRPYIDQILNGAENILVSEKCVFFAKTSGTTGRPKLIPLTDRAFGEYRAFVSPMLWALEKFNPGSVENGFCMSGKFLEERSAGGTPIGQATAFVRRAYQDYPYFASAPEGVFEETNYELRYFMLAYYALNKPLKVLCSLNPSTLLTLFKNIEKYKQAFVVALREGKVSEGPDGLESFDKELQGAFKANPGAAERLASCFDKGGKLNANDLWPDLKIVQTWQGGSTKHYLSEIKSHCPRSVLWPMVSGSSEAALLVPLTSETTGGVPAVCSTFFEFLPEDADPHSGPHLSVAELEKDGTYRMIVTNSRGLYRLAMEDIFKVDGFHDGMPVLTYLHRTGNTSSITGEKIAEKDVTFALAKAQAEINIPVSGFQMAPEWGSPPRYVMMTEVTGPTPSTEELEKFRKAFEAGLRAANTEYEAKRDSGRLALVTVCVLDTGEFERVKKAKAASLGRSDIQLKTPVLTRELVDLTTLKIKTRVD